jgi:hypothetical protein
MLTETISGKCPCCGHDKMIQRYGSMGYLQLDGCAKCGFGYSTNHYDDDEFGVEAWLPFATHLFTSATDKDYDELSKLPSEERRKMVYDWLQSQERFDDIENTIFDYSDEDIKKHQEFNLPVFK